MNPLTYFWQKLLLSLVSYICKENFKLDINNYRSVHNFVNFSRLKLRFTLFSSSSSLWFKCEKKIKLNSGQSVEILRDGTRNGHWYAQKVQRIKNMTDPGESTGHRVIDCDVTSKDNASELSGFLTLTTRCQ